MEREVEKKETFAKGKLRQLKEELAQLEVAEQQALINLDFTRGRLAEAQAARDQALANLYYLRGQKEKLKRILDMLEEKGKAEL